MSVFLFVLLLILAAPACAQFLEGRVYDAATREPIAKVEILLLENGASARSDRAGQFRIEPLPPGEYTLRVSTIGYRALTQPIRAGAETVDVALVPDTLRRVESVNVSAGPFVKEAPSTVDLSGSELRNLASVLADDPLRAVQSLPGVTSNDDFSSQFALRGASPYRAGIYIDDVLLHAPFHSVQGDPTSASLTQLQGDLLDSAVLHQAAPPVRYADRTAGIVDLRSREAQPKIAGRVNASASNVAGTAEGPLGDTVNWLVAARKSYLQYLIGATADDTTIAFGFWDTQGRISWRPAPKHQFTLMALDGHSALDRSEAIPRSGLNSLIFTDYHVTLANLGWHYTPSEKLLVSTRGAWIRERYENSNRDNAQLAQGYYGEWVWNTNATWLWNESSPLDAGASVRRLRDNGEARRLFTPPQPATVLDRFGGRALRTGGFVQQSWALAGMRFRAGARFDRHELNAVGAASPYASVALPLWSRARLTLEAGHAVQYPELSQMTSIFGRLSLLPERATHYTAAIDQPLGERTRLRAEVYNRLDRDLLFRPGYEARWINGRIVDMNPLAPWQNSLRGYGRGAQIFVQRRAANGLSGWLSYGYGYSRLRGGALAFPSDYDQRHLVQAFASYRIRPTVNVSGKWVYGSGLPVPGFYERRNDRIYLQNLRNRLRLPDYQRLDLRVNKSIVKRRYQLTVFGEVINVTARDNFRIDDPNSYNRTTGEARVNFDRMFPLLPSAGLVVDF